MSGNMSGGGPRRAIRRWQATGNFVIFVLPAIAIFTAIVFVPIVWTAAIGLTDERASRSETSFVGFDNFVALLSDSTFLQSLSNTIIVTVIVVVVTNALGIAVALLLRRTGWFYNMLRGVFFIPVILSAVVVSVIWRSLLVDDGLINNVLRALGVEHPPGWLTDANLALYSVAWITIWQLLGFAVVVYLAGLAGVPEDIEEAATLDGATSFARFRHITWPLLAPALTITTVMLMISTFKIFDQIKVLTNGGPGTGTTATIAFSVIRTAFENQRVGYGSAMAAVMLLIVGVATAVALRLLQRREVTF